MQARMLLAAPDRSTIIGIRDHLILSFLLYNVLRRGAIVGIKKGYIRQEGRYDVLWYRNKGDQQVKTKIKPQIAETISDYIISLKEYGYYLENNDYLFFRIRGRSGDDIEKLSDQSVYNIVKKYFEMAGFDIHPHELRHTGITTALDAGAKIEKVQAMAAHRSVETTLQYYRNKENLQDHGTDYIDY